MSAKFFRKFSSSSGSAVSSPIRSASPSSPTRSSRMQEKEELVGLNNRLAAYIEKVRSLEQENNRLTTQIKSSQDVVTREVTNIKSLYEDELATTRGILDETAKERAKLQIDLGTANSDKEELKFKLQQKERDLKAAEDSADKHETEINSLQRKLNKINADKKKDDHELKDLRVSSAKLRQQLDETRSQLESESLNRVDLMNRLQSQREDFDFKMNVYEEQLKESHTRSTISISEVDGPPQSSYEDRLRTALQELRDQYEQQMKNNRDEIEQMYEVKMSELRGSQSRSQQSTSSTLKELRETRARIEQLNGRTAHLEASNASLSSRVRELETQLDNERAEAASALAHKDQELSALEQRMQEHLQEYQDLMDIKVALDIEISAYRKLLESEEARLNLSPLGRFSARGKGVADSPSVVRSGKRKRTAASHVTAATVGFQLDSSSSSHGPLEIVEECADGKFIKVRNNSDKEVSLGGMQLVRTCSTADGDNAETSGPVEYKFARAVKLAAGELCSVYSSDAGMQHEPPHALVMRGQSWTMADNFCTTLLDKSGEEMAKRVSRRFFIDVANLDDAEENGNNDSQSSEWSLLNIFGGKRGTPRQ